jgi:hypothetical protein
MINAYMGDITMSIEHINSDDPGARGTEAAEPEATPLPDGVLSEEELQDLAGGAMTDFANFTNRLPL